MEEGPVLTVATLTKLKGKRLTMEVIIKGKHMDVAPRLRQIIERKVQKLTRLVAADSRVEVTVTEEKTRSANDRFTVQLALTGNAYPVRSEMSAVNANAALELALDKVTSQLGRQKGRQTTMKRHHTLPVKVLALSRAGSLTLFAEEEEQYVEAEVNERTTESLDQEHNEEIWSRVLEIRRVHNKPMGDQEVIAQMEMLGLTFLPFFNEATNTVNVMYRLAKGGYGLLVPELD
jgi:putative sigma-54 modulation protein